MFEFEVYRSLQKAAMDILSTADGFSIYFRDQLRTIAAIAVKRMVGLFVDF